MTFSEKYSKILSVVQEDIDKINLLDGIDIQEPLKSSLLNILNAPSKHIRPLVSFLYLKASGIEIDENQIEYQTAIELVHNASLIHDDIIDESDMRRTVSTINSEFDSKLAVIAGDYLLSVAMKKVINLGIPKLVDMFCETLKYMTLGEISQYFDKFKVPSIERYIEKSEQKTAKLFETALEGAILINRHSEALAEESQNIMGSFALLRMTYSDSICQSFAKNFGIAFQIRDDLINCLTSKSDITEGVYTAPVIFSRCHCEGVKRPSQSYNNEITTSKTLFSPRNDECVSDVNITDIGIENTKTLLNNYVETAHQSLLKLEDNVYRQKLIELLGLLRDE